MQDRRILKKDVLVSHEKIIDITRPAYLFGLWGAIITLMVSTFILMNSFRAGNLFRQGTVSFFEFGVFIYLIISLLMLVSVFILRKEHHSFGGSVMLLCSSIIGLTIASGLLVGPILGIIGGILGMSEHEKLIKHHLE